MHRYWPRMISPSAVEAGRRASHCRRASQARGQAQQFIAGISAMEMGHARTGDTARCGLGSIRITIRTMTPQSIRTGRQRRAICLPATLPAHVHGSVPSLGRLRSCQQGCLAQPPACHDAANRGRPGWYRSTATTPASPITPEITATKCIHATAA